MLLLAETGGCLPLLLVSGMGNYAEAPDLTEPGKTIKLFLSSCQATDLEQFWRFT